MTTAANSQPAALPEGTLRTIQTEDERTIRLSYSVKYGYHIGTRFQNYASQLKSLDLGQAMIEALAFCTSEQMPTMLKHVRTEYKRLELTRYDTPAMKQNAIIFHALRRLEGLRPHRIGKYTEEWRYDGDDHKG